MANDLGRELQELQSMPGAQIDSLVAHITTALRVMQGNVGEVERWARVFDDPGASLEAFNADAREIGDAVLARSTRFLNNFLASAESFRNVATTHLKREERRDRRYQAAGDAVRDLELVPVVAFVRELRDISLHQETVVAMVEMRAQVRVGGLTTVFHLDREQICRCAPWRHVRRRDVESMPEPIEVASVATAYSDASEVFLATLADEINRSFDNELREYATRRELLRTIYAAKAP